MANEPDAYCTICRNSHKWDGGPPFEGCILRDAPGPGDEFTCDGKGNLTFIDDDAMGGYPLWLDWLASAILFIFLGVVGYGLATDCPDTPGRYQYCERADR